MQIAEARPPYIAFEVKAIEDRQASIEAGYYKTTDVDYVLITPQGSKDRIERLVSDWLPVVEQQVAEGRCPREWLAHYRACYKAWKEGNELPLDGTPIVTWPSLSPSQVKQCIEGRVKTVEDLANANEETIMRLGMGGRALKDKAVTWLAAAGGPGKVAAELDAAKKRADSAEDRVTALEKQVKELLAAARK